MSPGTIIIWILMLHFNLLIKIMFTSLILLDLSMGNDYNCKNDNSKKNNKRAILLIRAEVTTFAEHVG